MPLQSGSDDVLRRCGGPTAQSKYLGIIDRVRAAIPDAAITTDIIVGFPGETEDGLPGHPRRGRAGAVRGAFTFQYSKRPGTPAADLPDQIAPGGGQGPLPAAGRGRRRRRLDREQGARSAAASTLMVAEGEGRKDAATHRLSGRARDNRLVHFAARRDRGPTRRRGHRRGHLRRAAPPGRRRPGRRTPHPLAATPGRLRTRQPAAGGRRSGHADRRAARRTAGLRCRWLRRRAAPLSHRCSARPCRACPVDRGSRLG